MTAEEFTRFRALLQECRQQRLAQVQALSGDDSLGQDPVVTAAQLHSARQVLEDVEAALARLDAGTYGRCSSCSTVIPAPRLELRPYTDACVECTRSQAPGR